MSVPVAVATLPMMSINVRNAASQAIYYLTHSRRAAVRFRGWALWQSVRTAAIRSSGRSQGSSCVVIAGSTRFARSAGYETGAVRKSGRQTGCARVRTYHEQNTGGCCGRRWRDFLRGANSPMRLDDNTSGPGLVQPRDTPSRSDYIRFWTALAMALVLGAWCTAALELVAGGAL